MTEDDEPKGPEDVLVPVEDMVEDRLPDDKNLRKVRKSNPNAVDLEALADKVGLPSGEVRRIIIKAEHEFGHVRGTTVGKPLPR